MKDCVYVVAQDKDLRLREERGNLQKEACRLSLKRYLTRDGILEGQKFMFINYLLILTSSSKFSLFIYVAFSPFLFPASTMSPCF